MLEPSLSQCALGRIPLADSIANRAAHEFFAR
jgi:hypothetical protein